LPGHGRKAGTTPKPRRMATNIRIVYDVKKKQIDAAEKSLKKLDKTTGLTNKEVTRLNKKFNKQQKELAQSTKGFNKMNSSMGSFVKLASAAFAINLLKNFGSELIRLSDIQAKSEAKLLTALKGREDVQRRLMAQARQLQKITLFGDEATIEAQAFLASLGLNEDAIRRLTPLVQDLATKMGGDLRSAADLIAKSVGSSTNALSRYGIEIKGAVGSTERLESAINALNQQVGGQSVAAAKAGAGQFTILGNTIGDIKEEMGAMLIEGLNPMISAFNEFLSISLSEELEKEKAGINALVGAITDANIKQEERNTLIGILQQEYSSFLENLDAETVSNEQLRDRLKEVNAQLTIKIQQQLLEEKVGKLLKEQAKAQLEIAAQQRRTQQEGGRIAEVEFGPSGLSPKIITVADEATGAINRLRRRINEINKELADTNELFKEAFGGGGAGGAGGAGGGGAGGNGGNKDTVDAMTESLEAAAEAINKLFGDPEEDEFNIAEIAATIEDERVDIAISGAERRKQIREEELQSERDAVAIRQELANVQLNMAANVVGAFSKLAKDGSEAQVALLVLEKLIAVGRVLTNLAAENSLIALTAAQINLIPPFVGGALYLATHLPLASARATGSLVQIAAQAIPELAGTFHEGGEITGLLRHGDVSITAQEGEFMIKTKAVDHYGLQAMESINNMEFNTVGFSDDNIVAAIEDMNRSFANRPVNMIKFDERGFRRSLIKGMNETIYVTNRYV